MASPRVACLILNTNRRDDTLACLASLQASTYPNQFTLVLDCQSTDGSVEAVNELLVDPSALGGAADSPRALSTPLSRGDRIFRGINVAAAMASLVVMALIAVFLGGRRIRRL